MSKLQEARDAANSGKKLTTEQADLLARDSKVAGGDKSLDALKKAASGDKIAKTP